MIVLIFVPFPHQPAKTTDINKPERNYWWWFIYTIWSVSCIIVTILSLIFLVTDYFAVCRSVNDFHENEVDKDKSVKGSFTQLKSNSKWSNQQQTKENVVNCQRDRRNKTNKEITEHNSTQKDEYCLR